MNFYFSKYLTYLLQEIGRCQEMTLCEGFVSYYYYYYYYYYYHYFFIIIIN